MKYEQLLNLTDAQAGFCGLFCVSGSFGLVDGDSQSSAALKKEGDCYRWENEVLRLTAQFEVQPNGAVLRTDSLTNLSAEPICLNRFFSRFTLEGCDYEVYTQYNTWQHESEGAWQRLQTQVTAASLGIRTCDGAAPVMALYNRQCGKTLVFHLLPNCQWSMTAAKHPQLGKMDLVTVQCGLEDSALALTVEPGETLQLPQILFYQTDSREDLGAHKLHEVYNRLYPRKTLPILYNTWLLNFDNIDYEEILRQVDCAADLGIETFVVDAGWFGTQECWGNCIGDWTENQVGGFHGRLSELSAYVRSKGLAFGLWLEPERALPTTEIVKAHPDYFINDIFLNFANPDALNYILEVTCGLIEKYSLSFMKFDFNATLPYDPSHTAFYRYMQGQRRFVEELRRRFPTLYLTNCASGGYRMELGQGTLFDSFWISDNQGPYDGLRIFCDTAKRMAPAMIEKWNVQTFCPGFPQYGSRVKSTLPISCNNATWDFVLNVQPEYTFGFLCGGPIGFSCNIADFPADYKQQLKAFLTRYKQDREFYRTATLRILCDTGNIVVLQYSSPSLERCLVQVFTKLVFQRDLTVYPAVKPDADYRIRLKDCADTVSLGAELVQDGITLKDLRDNDCRTLEIYKV